MTHGQKCEKPLDPGFGRYGSSECQNTAGEQPNQELTVTINQLNECFKEAHWHSFFEAGVRDSTDGVWMVFNNYAEKESPEGWKVYYCPPGANFYEVEIQDFAHNELSFLAGIEDEGATPDSSPPLAIDQIFFKYGDHADGVLNLAHCADGPRLSLLGESEAMRPYDSTEYETGDSAHLASVEEIGKVATKDAIGFGVAA